MDLWTDTVTIWASGQAGAAKKITRPASQLGAGQGRGRRHAGRGKSMCFWLLAGQGCSQQRARAGQAGVPAGNRPPARRGHRNGRRAARCPCRFLQVRGQSTGGRGPGGRVGGTCKRGRGVRLWLRERGCGAILLSPSAMQRKAGYAEEGRKGLTHAKCHSGHNNLKEEGGGLRLKLAAAAQM